MSVSRETSVGEVDVSRETRERLEVFSQLVLKWNRRINLVSPASEALVWKRHVCDSLQLSPLIPPGTQAALDIGSGAGFPGLVLAIALDVPFVLVEADSRKAAFLLEAARVTRAPAHILKARVEAIEGQAKPLITARAVAPLPKLLEWATPHLAPGGTMLFLKGQSVEREIAEAAASWTMRIERHISSNGEGVILRITEIKRA